MIRRRYSKSTPPIVRRRGDSHPPTEREIFQRMWDAACREERENGWHPRAIADWVGDFSTLPRKDLNKLGRKFGVGFKGARLKLCQSIALMWEKARCENWLKCQALKGRVKRRRWSSKV